MIKRLFEAIFPARASARASAGDELGDFRAERENEIYRQRFGAIGGGAIATPSSELLGAMLPGVDARFQHVGVLVYPPLGERAGHTFVTSGLSDPWEFAAAPGKSGLGFELVFTTAEAQTWPIGLLLRLMLDQLGIARGSRRGLRLESGDRVPLRPLGVAAEPQAVTAVIVARAEGSSRISTGIFELVRLVAVTTEEYAWSLSAGTQALEKVLEERRLVTLPNARETIPEARGASLPEAMKRYF